MLSHKKQEAGRKSSRNAGSERSSSHACHVVAHYLHRHPAVVQHESHKWQKSKKLGIVVQERRENSCVSCWSPKPAAVFFLPCCSVLNQLPAALPLLSATPQSCPILHPVRKTYTKEDEVGRMAHEGMLFTGICVQKAVQGKCVILSFSHVLFSSKKRLGEKWCMRAVCAG